MSVVEHHDVVENGDTRTDTKTASSRLVVSPGQVIAGVLGLVIAAIGIAVRIACSGLSVTLKQDRSSFVGAGGGARSSPLRIAAALAKRTLGACGFSHSATSPTGTGSRSDRLELSFC